MEDSDLQDIISLNLTRAVQLCVDIAVYILADLEVKPPDTMGAAFDALMSAQIINTDLAVRLKKAVGFRNIAIHNYEEIDRNSASASSGLSSSCFYIERWVSSN